MKRVGSAAAAAAAGADAWGAPSSSVLATNITHEFSWVRAHDLFLVTQPGTRRATVAVGDDVCVLGSLEAANRVLAKEALDLTSPTDLARSIRMLLRGAGGFVGGPAFLQHQRAIGQLDLWIVRTGDKTLLARVNEQEPMLQKTTASAWNLHFIFLTLDGAVERWVVDGDGGQLSRAQPTVLCPPGTLIVPYA